MISCGGGIIKNAENMEKLRQNGIVFHIRRNVNALAVGGNRPLSTSREKLRQMEQERMPLYQKYSDIEINNDTVFKLDVQKVKEGFDEVLIINGPNINMLGDSRAGDLWKREL